MPARPSSKRLAQLLRVSQPPLVAPQVELQAVAVEVEAVKRVVLAPLGLRVVCR